MFASTILLMRKRFLNIAVQVVYPPYRLELEEMMQEYLNEGQ